MLVCLVLWMGSGFAIAMRSYSAKPKNMMAYLATCKSSMLGQKEYLPARPDIYWIDFMDAVSFKANLQEQGMTLVQEDNQTHKKKWVIQTDGERMITLPLLAFPAWRVMVNGNAKVVPFHGGLYRLTVHPGISVVEATWMRLPQVLWGAWLSFGSILVLGMCAWKSCITPKGGS